MRCADARLDLSAHLDDELTRERQAELDEHVAACAACASYGATLHRVRTGLRVEPVVRVIDLAPRLLAALEDEPAPAPAPKPSVAPRVSIAAAFVAAAVAGATFVGFWSGPEPVAARDLSQEVLRAQTRVDTLRAGLTVTEYGFHSAVPEREYEGTLAYRSPESLALHLSDVTAYPSDAWMPNDVDLVMNDDVAWSRGIMRCPREALPGCTPPNAVARATEGREPFPDAAPAPLDLVVPVQSFALGGPVEQIGTRDIDGRPAIGVRVTVAQLSPLLDGILAVGNWRPLHPTDSAEVWLDADALVPLALDVSASASPERQAWAASRGLEQTGRVLSLALQDVELNGALPTRAFPDAPADARVQSAGFSDEQTKQDRTLPAWLPTGMQEARAGVLRAGDGPEVSVTSFSDGRAWVKVSATSFWNSSRLFGTGAAPVREIAVDDGRGYVDDRNERIALHGESVEVLVEGSIPFSDLLRVAASLPVLGQPVPSDWDEATTASVGEIATHVPLVLLPKAQTRPPACRLDGSTATCTFAGPGSRGYRLVFAPGERLGPPFDVDARVVDLRGTSARWSPALGTLEWIERGTVVTLASSALGVDELVAIAEALEAR
jgi:hypothetical protein